jgi:hypothetical protein
MWATLFLFLFLFLYNYYHQHLTMNIKLIIVDHFICLVASFVMKLEMSNLMGDKFQSLFEKSIIGSLVSFFQSDHQH